MTAGYSGTPLAKKLGFKPGEPLWASGMPGSVKKALDAEAHPRYLARPTKALAAAHLFHTKAAKLKADLENLRAKLAPDGMIWVSWPKKGRAGRDRHHRRRDPHDCAADGLRRRESLRRGRNLVRPETRDPQSATLTPTSQVARVAPAWPAVPSRPEFQGRAASGTD